ncbi:helix-turn-helix domain-containing protein [Nocardiopsis sp. EMB25]|uniref:helix-turn-helix domain-containing protein n=1 Tax=Nocardiopsis sp. EMB25 TaxID=2835867 RepID=UPI002284DECA|nr:helix-turn-helix transcriptional regulator [Nocardiopsis sp. EMB25]MCY9784211.1 helix-turn-helix domain-containing protein [Nocardiopsis sp. EMB25]
MMSTIPTHQRDIDGTKEITVAQGSPVRRHYLVSQLKRLRSQAKMSQEQVANELGWDTSKLYRIENGRFVRLTTEAVAALCRLYGASDALREELVEIAKAARKQKPWWFQHEDVAGNAFYSLENEATKIQQYAMGVVPGLLQHPDYIEALMSRGFVADAEERQKRVAARIERCASILDRDHPPRIWAITDESALRCLVGGPKVMRTQFQHLMDLNQRPNIDIQVLLLSKGMAQSCGYTLLHLGETDQVGYLDVPPSGHFFEGSEELTNHERRFEYMQAAALPLDDTQDFIRRLAGELERS